jgi:hypothetical protein
MRRRTSSEWIGALDRDEPIVVRRASDRDAGALRDLAQLDGVRPLVGEILVAEVAGELRAAPAHGDGRALGDPFHRTMEIRELLELHARHLNGAGVRPARRLRRLVPGLRRLRAAL